MLIALLIYTYSALNIEVRKEINIRQSIKSYVSICYIGGEKIF